MTDSIQPRVWPVILSGGSGTRLWPKSRTLFPKQFHRLTSKHSLLQEALLRVEDTDMYAKPIVVCNEDHRFIVSEQADELGMELSDIVLEPEGRNTAPAVATATLMIQKIDPTGLVLVLAADHHIPNLPAFTAAVKLGITAATGDYICTFGIAPTCPETGYGYIKRQSQEVAPGVFKIDQFVEKPDLETAERYVADPSYAWNAGMFLFAARRMIEELNAHEPTIVPACEGAIQNGDSSDQISNSRFLRLSKEHFAQAAATSVDYAVMEHTKMAAVIPLDASWTDVGSWPSLFQTCVNSEENTDENKALNVFTKGEVHMLDVKNCYLSSDGPMIAAIGIENLCVVATDDAFLVLPMDRSQQVGQLAKALKKVPRTAHFAMKHTSEYKPFGSSKTIAEGKHFKILQVTVKPQSATSLQMHYHRAMHYVVVEGTASVTVGSEEMIINKNESTYIPVGTAHRLYNPGKVPLVVTEVQSGDYLHEDDIERLESPHGSSNAPTRPVASINKPPASAPAPEAITVTTPAQPPAPPSSAPLGELLLAAAVGAGLALLIRK